MQKIGQKQNAKLVKYMKLIVGNCPNSLEKQPTQEIYICINKKIKMKLIKPCVVKKMSRSRSR